VRVRIGRHIRTTCCVPRIDRRLGHWRSPPNRPASGTSRLRKAVGSVKRGSLTRSASCRVQRFVSYAGLTSPAVRPRAAISPDESALTTLVSGCWGSAKCLVVAAIAASAVATATLKYLNDGGPISAARRLEGDCIGDGCPVVITWTTQPAGGALSIMHATWRVSRTRVKAVQFPAPFCVRRHRFPRAAKKAARDKWLAHNHGD
jgi:hypothetical protein